ncbi:MAG: bacteriohopanetetrol glucosamine biosynthesis glycosyltransferase HpnI [Gammaproteobacteria bacterium]|jgi:ceramide glucosyltransferase
MTILSVIAGLLSLVSLSYVGFSILRVAAFGRRAAGRNGITPPVTILKPVCGLDAELYDNLRSFCTQDYPDFQVLFGLADAEDPALPVIRRLIGEFPERDIDVVIDGHLLGTNRKVSNLANMYPRARHDILVIADSDMRVGPDYLRVVAGAFADEKVGAVTCLYRGRPARGNLASSLGSAFINEWFLPSALVAAGVQEIRYCFGATMAVRRVLLERIGGFATLAPLLADDYMLGNLVSDMGYRVELSPYLVENIVSERNLRALFRHELRWARTVRSVRPLSYTFSLITHALPMSLLYLGVTARPWLGVAAVAAALSLRVLMQYVGRRSLDIRMPLRPWLVPLRDLLSFAVWAASFLGNNISWGRHHFQVDDNGQIVLSQRKETI